MKERTRSGECYDCVHKQDVPGNAHIRCNKPDASMTGNPHGVANGWFYYPSLFDPSWKETLCNNYESKEQVDAVVSQSISVAGKSK